MLDHENVLHAEHLDIIRGKVLDEWKQRIEEELKRREDSQMLWYIRDMTGYKTGKIRNLTIEPRINEEDIKLGVKKGTQVVEVTEPVYQAVYHEGWKDCLKAAKKNWR